MLQATRCYSASALAETTWRAALITCRRKNIGYLFAISHAAYAVYDGADAHQLMRSSIPMLTCGDTGPELANNVTAAPCPGLYTVVDATHNNILDPWQAFQRSPRHVASRSPSGASTQQLCFTRQAAAPLIQHSLTNQQVAVVDPTAFSIVLPQNTMVPITR
jgi:hypothetical protein